MRLINFTKIVLAGISCLYLVNTNLQAQTTNATLTISLYNNQAQLIAIPSGETASILCQDMMGSGNSFSTSITSGNSSVNLPVAGGYYYQCSCTGLTSYTSNGNGYGYVESGSTGTASIYLTSLNTSVTFELRDTQGNLVPVPSGGSAAIECNNYEGTYNITDTISAGQSSASTQVVGDVYYTCSLSGNLGSYTPSGNASVYVSTGSTGTATFYLATADSQITVNFVNNLGTAVTVSSGAKVKCTGYSSSDGFTTTLSSAATQAVVTVTGGSYQCDLTNVSGISAQQAYVYVSNSSTAAVSIVVTTLGSTITLQFTNSSGNAISVPTGAGYAYASCNSTDGAGNWFSGTPSAGDQSIQIQVSPGDYQCSAYLGSSSYTPVGSVNVTAVDGQTATAQVQFLASDSTITVNLVNSSGTATPVDEGGYASVYCYSSSGGYSANGSIVGGQSSVVLDVYGGTTYGCNCYLPGAAITGKDVTVPANGSASVNLTLAEHNATVMVELRDTAGNLITTLSNATVYASATGAGISDFAQAPFIDGSATISLVPGIEYFLSFWADPGTSNGTFDSSSGNDYLYSYESITVTPTSTAATTKVITLYQADSTINVTVTGVGSSNTMGGTSSIWVNASEVDKTTASFGGLAVNGEASIPVVGGKTYLVQVYGDYTLGIPSAPQEVTTTSGATSNVTFSFTAPDYTLNITCTPDDGATSGSCYCYAYTNTGQYAYTQAADFGSAASLALVSSLDWFISCNGFGTPSGGDYTYYSADLVNYTPISGSSTDSLSVALTANGVAFNEQFSYDPDQPQSLAFGGEGDNGYELTIPAGAFDNDGTVNLNINNTETVIGDGYTNPVPGAVINIEATDSNGDPLTLEPGQQLVITIPVNTDSLPDGVEEGDLGAGTFDDDTGSWSQAVLSEEEDTSAVRIRAGTTKRYKVSVSSTGIAGVVARTSEVNTGSEELSAPTNIKAKAKKNKKKAKKARKGNKKSIVVSWNAPETGTASSYNVTIKTKKGKTLKEASVEDTKATFKLAAGKYIAAVVAVGEDEDTTSEEATKNFTVKGTKE